MEPIDARPRKRIGAGTTAAIYAILFRNSIRPCLPIDTAMPNSLDDRLLLEAASFAARAHAGQLRKDGQTPYVSHVFRVCLVVRHLFGFDDGRMLAAALLHDTIEDTTTDFDDITRIFGTEIAEW